jgi:ribonuclease VapC
VIVDSSALIAILQDEEDARAYVVAIATCPESVSISAATLVESEIVTWRQTNGTGGHLVDQFIHKSSIVIEPFTAEQASIARAAYRQFGKGSGHPANLNMGDCFAYALAKDKGEPLLYKGTDFAATDIQSAI